MNFWWECGGNMSWTKPALSLSSKRFRFEYHRRWWTCRTDDNLLVPAAFSAKDAVATGSLILLWLYNLTFTEHSSLSQQLITFLLKQILQNHFNYTCLKALHSRWEHYSYFSSAPESTISAGHSAPWPWDKLCSQTIPQQLTQNFFWPCCHENWLIKTILTISQPRREFQARSIGSTITFTIDTRQL